jgi:hypothetical protein
MVKTHSGASNIFNIASPEQYRCQMLYYHNRLSRLYLAVYKGQQDVPAFYLLFSDVGYLDCPLNWQGADFSIAQDDACIELLLETGLIGKAILTFPNAYASITDYAHLYQAQTSSGKLVRIIASAASMTQTAPRMEG